MLYRYKCHDCGSYVSLLVKAEFCKCPMCDGELELCREESEITLLSPTSVKIQYLIMETGRELLVIDGRHDVRAFQYDYDKDNNLDWQPIPTIDIFKPYGNTRKVEGRIF
jgi:hypothetical protein